MEKSAAASGKVRKFQIAQYSLVVFLYWFSLYIYVPTLPVYFESILKDIIIVGTVLSMYGLGLTLIRLPVGILADWRGWHRQLTFFCLAMVAIGPLLMARGQSSAMLGLGRLITGFGNGGWVLLMVAFSSLFDPKDAVRAAAILTFFNTSGRFMATLMTGFLNDMLGFAFPFYLATVMALVSMIILLPRYYDWQKSLPVSAQSIKGLITRVDVYLPSIMGVFSQIIVFAATFSFIPILARDFGASNVHLSMLVSMNMGMVAAGNLLVSWLIKKFNSTRVIYFGFASSGIGLLFAASASSLGWIFIAQLFLAIAGGLNYPTLMGLSIKHVNPGERSIAMGIHQATYSLGMFIGPWLGGILVASYGLQPMFAMIAIICVSIGMYLNSRYNPAMQKIGIEPL